MTMQGAIHCLLLLVFAPIMVAHADTDPMTQIDVFVTSTIDVTGHERVQHSPGIAIIVHAIDGIEQVKATLSRDLPGNAEAARRQALARMKQYGKYEQQQLRQSAKSLLLARQLGVRRYPAIVFDRQWVVYGVTDLRHAYAFFQERHAGENP